MLQYQTVSPGTLAVLKQLMRMPELNAFYLVGGTSLALQTGHRISVDLDFFTFKSFDIDSLQKKLSKDFTSFELLRVSHTGFTSTIDGVKCDFFNWATPFIGEPVADGDLRLCSLDDIAAFKMDAIVTRKVKKDFWDIDILVNKLGFEKILKAYRTKFPYIDLKVALDALSQIDLADDSEDPLVIIPKSWEAVKKNIKDEWISYSQSMLTKKENEKKERMRKAEELLNQKKNKK